MLKSHLPKLLTVIALLIICNQANAIIIVDKRPPEDRLISLFRQHVDVTINNGVSETVIQQTFHNNGHRDLEGTYLFPIPDDASVSRFSMMIGGVEVAGEILDKEDAARQYHSIVRQMKDPGLLEYVGKGLFRARVYPIPARGDVDITIRYQQVLPYDNGTVTYRFTSEDPMFYRAPIKDYKLNVSIHSGTDVKAVYSPTHQITVDRPDNRNADITLYRSNQSKVKDFLLYYTVSKEDIGLNLLTQYDPDKGHGHFLGLIAPDLKKSSDVTAQKNVLFVLDVSGSMSGVKIRQAKAALRYCLNSLSGDDKFGIVSYSDEINDYSSELLPVTGENVSSALTFVDGLAAAGGTDINGALHRALSIQGRKAHADYMIFLSDGEPTVGETNPERIIRNVDAANINDWKIFSFGVGDDVDAKLLDRLSAQSGGTASYVRPSEDVEIKVSSFFAKIANPAMTDIRVFCDNIDITQVYPRDLPDLFYGMQLVIAGKYTSPGGAKVRLEGLVEGALRVFEYDVEFSARPGNDNLVPRQWAIRRIGYLLEQIREHPNNDEIKNEIVRLSKEYGIATPYTSFFVEDPAMAYRPGGGFQPVVLEEALRAGRVSGRVDHNFSEPLSASRVIDQSQTMKKMKGDAFAMDEVQEYELGELTFMPQTDLEEKIAGQLGSNRLSNLVTIGDRTFQKIAGSLVDSKYDGTQDIIKIKPFSEAYFSILKLKPELGKYLAEGGDMLVVMGNIAVRICEDGEEVLSEDIRDLL